MTPNGSKKFTVLGDRRMKYRPRGIIYLGRNMGPGGIIYPTIANIDVSIFNISGNPADFSQQE